LLVVNFPAHGFNFDLEFFVFGDFVAEKAGGYTGFGFEAGWGQDVGVAGFVGAFFKILALIQPLAIRALRQ